MNAYELKQAERKARLEAAADRARNASSMVYTATKQKESVIPFGQPILVGHHSEGRDRNFRKSIDNGFGKAFALSDKAEHYDRRAASVGKGGISSDDPDAIKKLKTQLADAQEVQERMKKVNACVRKNDRPGLEKLGYTEEQVIAFFTKDFAGRIGFPSYQLTNNNANMNRIKDRIAELEKKAERQTKEHAGNGYTYREDTEENRVMFIFDGKPAEEIRKILSSNGFKWSPSREGKPWVRQLTNAGIYAGKLVCEKLDALAE